MIDKTKLISRLKNHKCTLDELCRVLKHPKEEVTKAIEGLKKEGIKVDAYTQKKGKDFLYYINILPDTGNVYYISGMDNKPRVMDFVATSDFHIVSKFFRRKKFHAAMRMAEDSGIKRVYVAGDVIDGRNIYKGHDENIITNSLEGQLGIAADVFSRHPNLEFWAISGNHDYSFTQMNGVRPLEVLETMLDNFKNLGDLKADVIYHGIKIRLVHGAAGRTYSKSYPSQCYLRDLFGGSERSEIKNMPHVIIMGHYHVLYQGKDHGIYILQPASFQDSENEYCIRRGLTGPSGCLFVHTEYQNGQINRFRTEFISPNVKDSVRKVKIKT